MHRPTHDALARNVLDDLGTLERGFAVPAPEPRGTDLRFAPAAEHTEARRALGLLGRMTDAPCLFVPFHEAPSPDEVQACLCRLLNAMQASPLHPWRTADCAWLLCAARPDDALARFEALPMRDWPAGFYALRGLPLAIVVLSELPLTDDSAALRLMGAESTKKRAFDELRARCDDAPRTRRLVELIVQTTVLADGERDGQENKMVDTTRGREIIERITNEVRAMAFAEGVAEGEMRASSRQFERRLSRALTSAEAATLSARLSTLGLDRLCDLGFDLDAAALAAWLALPTAT